MGRKQKCVNFLNQCRSTKISDHKTIENLIFCSVTLKWMGHTNLADRAKNISMKNVIKRSTSVKWNICTSFEAINDSCIYD